MREKPHQTEVLEKSTDIIHEEVANAGLQIIRIILFGSRARGDYRLESDWDFIVSVNKEISFPKRAVISSRILSRLAEYGIDADLVFKTEEKIRQEQNNVGVITHYALKDGVEV